MSDTIEHGTDNLHGWWGLSYAQYLTIPRSVMQSMPDEWQGKMFSLLEQLDDSIDWRPKEGCYWVDLRAIRYDSNGHAAKGKLMDDPFADYQRGRRRIPFIDPSAL